MRLEMTREMVAAMLAEVRASAPEEACGLVGGEAEGRARALYPIENIRHSAVAYEMNPEEQIRAMLEMEAHGWELLAIYHSHPAGPPAPSETDVRLAYYPDSLYLICAPDGPGEWHARAFQIVAGQVTEQDLRLLTPDY